MRKHCPPPFHMKGKVKLSHYRSGEVLSAQEVEASRMYRKLANEGYKVVSTRHRLPFPLGDTPGTHFC